MVVARLVEEGACWTRVLSRSAGCRRIEVERPERKPAANWKAVGIIEVSSAVENIKRRVSDWSYNACSSPAFSQCLHHQP
jgi:hypothetical protein